MNSLRDTGSSGNCATFCACLALAASSTSAQLPTYTGAIYGDALSAHDGKLRWAVGVQNVQVARSAPDNPAAKDGNTTVYRHHPMAGSYSVVVSNAVGPAAPAGLTALASNSLVRLTWSAVPGATGYNVQRSASSGGPYTMVGTTAATSYNDTAVINGFLYYYVVTAINGAGDSLPSGQVSAMPPMEDFRTNPAARGWTAINSPTSGGNNFGWSSGTANVLGAGNEGEMGGIFARSATIRFRHLDRKPEWFRHAQRQCRRHALQYFRRAVYRIFQRLWRGRGIQW